ncbi:serine O-acetyltransferase [Peribacillus simplex]|uniref:serine O-acetyltransferase n=1 Tax=Peribacillus simplex TaxID=1478 RepID=UPI00380A99A8
MINKIARLRSVPVIGKLSYIILRIMGLDIPKGVRIGNNVDFVHGGFGVVIHPNTTIEDNVKIYQGVTFGRADIHLDFEQSKMERVVIKKGAIVCAGAKVLCKERILTIGENTIIGANSVLLSSTGSNEIWAGIPAKKIKDRSV